MVPRLVYAQFCLKFILATSYTRFIIYRIAISSYRNKVGKREMKLTVLYYT